MRAGVTLHLEDFLQQSALLIKYKQDLWTLGQSLALKMLILDWDGYQY